MGQILLGKPHLEDVIASGEDVCVAASGGLDSAYALWRLTNETSGHIHVHHIDLGAQHETPQAYALERQLDYLGRERFTVHQSTIRGSALMDFWLAAILTVSIANHNACKFVVTGDDLIARTGGRAGLSEIGQLVGLGKSQLCLGSSVPDLAAEYARLPDEYRAITWSCVNPRLKDYAFVRCECCQQCTTHKAFGIWGKFNHTLTVTPTAVATE